MFTFRFNCLYAIAALLMTNQSALAEYEIVTDPKTAARLISGKVQRVWIAEAVKSPLGGDTCEEGLRYRYRPDGTADHEACIDGSWAVMPVTWNISGGEIEILTIVLDEIEYEATLVKRPDNLELVLEGMNPGKDVKPDRITMTYALD